jgi:hypothetical protein
MMTFWLCLALLPSAAALWWHVMFAINHPRDESS